jgi:hypothetical protein
MQHKIKKCKKMNYNELFDKMVLTVDDGHGIIENELNGDTL